jgi:hypothetical protein
MQLLMHAGTKPLWMRSCFGCRQHAEAEEVWSCFGCRPDALAHGEADLAQTGELMRFTISANMAGIPALSLPVGHSAGGAHISFSSLHILTSNCCAVCLPPEQCKAGQRLTVQTAACMRACVHARCT